MVTSADERGRLAELYSAMSDAELERIAKDPGSLTDAAQNALQAEVRRRGLSPGGSYSVDQADAAERANDADIRPLVTIRKFRDLPEALLAKGGLESAGIECYLADDNMVRMDWFISNLLGGVKLQVKLPDAPAAAELLDQPIPEDFEVEGCGEYHQPKCPDCQSLDVGFEELNKPVAYTSAYIGLPFPLHRHAWKCHDCGREWQDTGFDQSQEP